MDFEQLHRMLEETRLGYEKKGLWDIYNTFEIANPSKWVDCDSKRNMDNFMHIVNGDKLLYAEIANSTPFEGYKIDEKFYPLITKNSRIACVYPMDAIERMGDNIKDVWVSFIDERNNYSSQPLPTQEHMSCKVVDYNILDDVYMGEPYKTMCIVFWMKGNDVKHAKNLKNGLGYTMTSCFIEYEICSICGKKATRHFKCEHLEHYKQGNTVNYSILEFSKLNALYLIASECLETTGD